METQTRAEALLVVIERRLAQISERQHALAAEKARLADLATPLRLGVTTPGLALAQLRSKGIVLRGSTTTSAVGRPTEEAVLRVVISRHPKITAFSSRSETA
jgi:hypothetical protein